MRNKLLSIAFTFICTLLSFNSLAQCVPNFFMFSNRVECLGTAGVKIHWTQEQWVAHDVYRRSPGDTVWGNPLVANYWGNPVLVGSSLIQNYYIAADQLPGTTYEYRFTRFVGGGSYSGYIMAGCQLPETPSRGNVIMVVTNLIADSLGAELDIMRKDLIADGYKVTRFDVSETATPTEVKNSIQTIYQSLNNEKAYIYLIGHVPVPYSGVMMNDDIWEHRGAWPSDVYYADMDGLYTDSIMNWTNSARDENDNIPGDGKFDKNLLTSKPEFAIGRVDLSNLICFTTLNEVALTRRYFAKDHAFRVSSFQTNGGGFVYDLMPFIYGTNPQAEGFTEYYGKIYGNNFPALTDSAYTTFPYYKGFWSGFQDFHNSIYSRSHRFSFIGGTASYTNIDNISTAGQIANMAGFNSVFNWTYGRYFPDWDNVCNFQRMCIAAPGTSLTQIAAANPSHYYHMFGLDRTIGETLLENQWNNNQNYHNLGNPGADNYYRRTHICMMGDPTLRLIYEKQPSNAAATAVPSSSAASITWQSNGDITANYLIFRSGSYSGNFIQIGSTFANQTSFVDPSPLPNLNIYLIRARALCETGSGSYYNLSPGIFAEFTASYSFSSLLNSSVVCETESAINVDYTFSSNLLNEAATITCYANNSNQPFYTETITLTNTESFQFQIPAGTIGTWVKYKTSVSAFLGLETLDSVFINLKPTAQFSSEIIGGSVTAIANSVNVNTFQWLVNGSISGNESQLTIEIPPTSFTAIELIVENNCGSDSTQQIISVTSNEQIEKNRTLLFPNPANDVLSLSNVNNIQKITVYDATGRVIETLPNISSQIQVKHLSSGMYFLKIEETNSNYTLPFVVKH